MQDDPTLPVDDKQSRLANPPPGLAGWGGFSLLERVGHGGFGEVYRAWDAHLEREVALKLLLPGSVGGEEEYRAMLQEARALASVRHPNVVHVYGMDRQDGRVGFWTDFVHGKTLTTLLADQGPFGYREAALIGLDVAKALSAVHRVGLLHRDIKAENVMREEGGRILLMDFGLSALPHQQKDFAGTPLYMAPELFEGAAATVESDIYAVGVLLFFLVTGKHPTDHTSSSGTPPPRLASDERTSDVAADPRTSSRKIWASRAVLDHRPDLPESFARTIDTAIHPNPLKRFSSAGALSSALSEVLVEPTQVGAASNVPQPESKQTSWWAYAGLILVLLLFAGSIAFYRYAGPAAKARSATAVSMNEKYARASGLLRRSDKQSNVTQAVV